MLAKNSKSEINWLLEKSRSSTLDPYSLQTVMPKSKKLSFPRRQHRTKTIPRKFPLPIHLLQDKKLLICLFDHVSRCLNLRAASLTRARKGPLIVEDFDLVDGESRRENDCIKDFVVRGFDCRGADRGGEVLCHKNPRRGVEGEDFGGGVAEGGLIALEEGFDGFSDGGHYEF